MYSQIVSVGIINKQTNKKKNALINQNIDTNTLVTIGLKITFFVWRKMKNKKTKTNFRKFFN